MKNPLLEAVGILERVMLNLDPESEMFGQIAMVSALVSESYLAIDPYDGLSPIQRLELQAKCAREAHGMMGDIIDSLNETRKHLRGGNITTG